MKKFKCVVTRTDEYIIEIDDSIIDEEWMAHFRRYFYEFDDLEEHAEHLAQFQARFGNHAFIEGYGVVKRNGKLPYPYYGKKYEGKIDKEELAFNIKIVNEDNDCEVEVKEIE